MSRPAVALVPSLNPGRLPRWLEACATQCQHAGHDLVTVTACPATARHLHQTGHAVVTAAGLHWPLPEPEPEPDWRPILAEIRARVLAEMTPEVRA